MCFEVVVTTHAGVHYVKVAQIKPSESQYFISNETKFDILISSKDNKFEPKFELQPVRSSPGEQLFVPYFKNDPDKYGDFSIFEFVDFGRENELIELCLEDASQDESILTLFGTEKIIVTKVILKSQILVKIHGLSKRRASEELERRRPSEVMQEIMLEPVEMPGIVDFGQKSHKMTNSGKNARGGIFSRRREKKRKNSLAEDSDSDSVSRSSRNSEISFPAAYPKSGLKSNPAGFNAQRSTSYAFPSLSNTAKISIKLPSVNFSVIDFSDEKEREEVTSITFGGLLARAELGGSSGVFLRLNLNKFQVDNNSNLLTDYPFVIGNYEVSRSSVDRVNDVLALQALFEAPDHSNSFRPTTIELSVLGIKAQLEESFVNRLAKLAHKYTLLAAGNPSTPITLQSSSEKALKTLLGPEEWKTAKLRQKTDFLYLRELALPSIAFEFSYIQDSSTLIENNLDLLSALFLISGGIEDARLSMSGFGLKKYSGTLDDLSTRVLEHYQGEVVKSKGSLIGSLNILGNPSKIIREFTGDIEMDIDPDFKTGGSVVKQRQNFISRGFKK